MEFTISLSSIFITAIDNGSDVKKNREMEKFHPI